jgi:hypothetical protein
MEEMDGEAVLYDPRTGAVHQFNATTFVVWKACGGMQTAEDIARELMKHGSVNAAQALRVVREAIGQLDEKELLVESGWLPSAAENSETVSLAASPTQVQNTADAFGLDRQESPPTRKPIPGHGVSRRELLGGGITKAMLAAPVISTFFAAGAYASGPSASAAFGAGGCKTVGYSCAVTNDCCGGASLRRCQTMGGPRTVCCVKKNSPGCVTAADCCDAGDVCVAGTCQ